MPKLGRRQRAGFFIGAGTSMPRHAGGAPAHSPPQCISSVVARMSGALLDRALFTLEAKRAAKSGDTRMSPSGRAFGATPLAHAGYAIGSKR